MEKPVYLDYAVVLQAMGMRSDLLTDSIRISRGRFTTMSLIEYATEEIIKAVKLLR